MEKAYTATLGEEINARNLKILKEKSNYIYQNGLFVPISRLMGLCLKEENDERTKAIALKREPRIDGVHFFCTNLLEAPLKEMTIWDYHSRCKKEKLYQSMKDVWFNIRNREIDEDAMIYHLYSNAINYKYQNIRGHKAMGERVVDSILESEIFEKIRPNFIKRLINL